MQCSQGTDLGILGSVFFLGNAISSLFVARLADIYGRKWVLAANQSVQFIAMIFFVNTTSYKIATFLMFVLGLCSNRWAIGYVYFSELLTQKGIKIFCPLLDASTALTMIAAALMV